MVMATFVSDDFEQFDEQAGMKICVSCYTQLQEPYVRCAECFNVNLCSTCFANGREVGKHLSNHAYSIINDRFPLLTDNWLACEENQLLDLLIECGYGNWDDIGRRLGRSPQECRKHYDMTYLKDPPDELKDVSPPVPSFQPTPLPPHLLRTTCENPPRNWSGLTGYNALRSEFEDESDGNIAEKDLALVTMSLDEPTTTVSDCWSEEDSQLVEALQVSMAQVYNDRLQERARRHKVLRDHGLILARKNYAAMSRFATTLGRATVESLNPFMQLLTGPQFDFLMEGLHVSKELSMRCARLEQLRLCGVTTMKSASLMKELSSLRSESRRELKAGILAMPTPSRPEVNKGGGRRQAPPLQIAGLPLYEILTSEERELCAHARIVPENFLEFRDLLTAECQKLNGMRLAHARRCIKIDVNKTRKLFDFLMKQGTIFPPAD